MIEKYTSMLKGYEEIAKCFVPSSERYTEAVLYKKDDDYYVLIHETDIKSPYRKEHRLRAGNEENAIRFLNICDSERSLIKNDIRLNRR